MRVGIKLSSWWMLSVLAAAALATFFAPAHAGADPPPALWDTFMNGELEERGFVEVHFKNGKTLRGEIIEAGEESFEISTPAGDSLAPRWEWVDRVEPLGETVRLVAEARLASERDELDRAADLLDRALTLDPELGMEAELRAHEIELQTRMVTKARAERDEVRLAVAQEKDRMNDKGAYALLVAELRKTPDDVEWLSEAVRLEQDIRRGGLESAVAGPIATRLARRLAELAPDSPVIAGIRGEQAVSRRLRERFNAEREVFLDSALDTARSLYRSKLYDSALDIIDRALMLGPSAVLREDLIELEPLVKSAYKAQLARARERAAQREREQLTVRYSRGRSYGSGGSSYRQRNYDRYRGYGRYGRYGGYDDYRYRNFQNFGARGAISFSPRPKVAPAPRQTRPPRILTLPRVPRRPPVSTGARPVRG